MEDVALIFQFQIDVKHCRVRGRIRGRVRVRIRLRVRVAIWVICVAIHRLEVYKLEQHLPSQMICGNPRCLGRPCNMCE